MKSQLTKEEEQAFFSPKKEKVLKHGKSDFSRDLVAQYLQGDGGNKLSQRSQSVSNGSSGLPSPGNGDLRVNTEESDLSQLSRKFDLSQWSSQEFVEFINRKVNVEEFLLLKGINITVER